MLEAASKSSPRRLALVITELEPGGAERCLVELATRLDRARFSPVVYSLGPQPASDKCQLVERLAEARIPTHFLDVTSAWQYRSAVRQLTQKLSEQAAEVVQTFLFHANVVGAQAARAAAVPHILTGIRVADPRWWRTTLERALTQHAEHFVCVSQSVAEFCRRRGFASEKLLVIPNGANLQRWQNAAPADLQQHRVPAGRRALLYVGRLDKQKGLDRFWHELPQLFRDLPQHDLLLVGAGPQHESLAHAAESLGVRERIHFLGWRDDVPAIMAASEALVLPSRWEGMPNVVLEAMAAGKPVVATQAEGTVELLGLAALDQTAPVGDWAALRKKLTEVITNKALGEQIAAQNRTRSQQFSVENMATRYMRLYSSLGKN